MTQEVNLEEIKEKLIEKLKPSGWAIKLKGFVQSSDFDKILQTLYNLREDNKRFTPPLKQVFRAFEECPVDKLKVIIVGQDPYPYLGVADGLAFSCGNTGKIQPSLRSIFDALSNTLDEKIDENPDLTRWSNQGVLLLNTALTCQVDKIGSHYAVWHEFLMYVMDILNYTDTGLIFILMGKQAQELESLIGPHHNILKVSHPASAAYTKEVWDCNDVFNKTNTIIKGQVGSEFQINW